MVRARYSLGSVGSVVHCQSGTFHFDHARTRRQPEHGGRRRIFDALKRRYHHRLLEFSCSWKARVATFSDLGPIPLGGPEHHESPLQIQSIKCMTSDFQLWRSRLASQSVSHVPDDKQPCSRPCGSSVGRHLKTLDCFSARHWTLSLRAEPNGLPTNDMAK